MTRRSWPVVLLAAVLTLAAALSACADKEKGAGSTSVSPSLSEESPALSAGDSAAGRAADKAVLPGSAPSAGQSATQGSAAPAAGSAQGGGAPLPGLDRKIIYTTFLDITVKDVQSSFERIGAVAGAQGGFVAESNMRQEGKERRGTVTIRVPADRYAETLAQVRGLAATVESERSAANDITEEYADLQARQRTLEATEAQLLAFLGQAKNVSEVLQVQDRLNTVRSEIERLKGRQNLLNRLTDLATLQVSLRPESAALTGRPDATGPGAAFARGWEASLELLGGVSTALITALAFSWWLLPFALLGLWLLRRLTRNRPAHPVSATADAG